MFKKMLRKMMHNIIQEDFAEAKEVKEGVSPRGADVLLGSMPLGMLVHPISNGYIMRIEPSYPRDARYAALGDTRPNATLIYAKDEKDIAEQIIAHQARHKLEIEPKQGEMFSATQMGAQTSAANATASAAKVRSC